MWLRCHLCTKRPIIYYSCRLELLYNRYYPTTSSFFIVHELLNPCFFITLKLKLIIHRDHTITKVFVAGKKVSIGLSQRYLPIYIRPCHIAALFHTFNYCFSCPVSIWHGKHRYQTSRFWIAPNFVHKNSVKVRLSLLPPLKSSRVGLRKANWFQNWCGKSILQEKT